MAAAVFESILKEGYEATDLKGRGELIVLVGFTGSGKSTLSKFLRQDHSLRVVENRQGFCNFADDEVTISSRNGYTSKTLYPNVAEDEQTGVVVVDCAGFEDTRSPADDLVASFLNKIVLDAATSLKIVIVENYNKMLLNEDRTAFLKVLKHLATLLKLNHRSFDKSISLVATKVELPYDDEKLHKAVRVFLEETLQHLESSNSTESREADIVRFLLDGEKFAIFRKPTKINEGPWKQLSQNYDNLRHLVFEKTQFASTIEGKFNVTVAPETINVIKGDWITDTEAIIYGLLDELTSKLKTNFDLNVNKVKHSQVFDFCHSNQNSINNIKTRDEITRYLEGQEADPDVLQSLQFQVTKAEFLYDVTNKDFSDVSGKISTLNGGLQALASHVRAHLDNYIVDIFAKASSTVDILVKKLIEKFDEKLTSAKETMVSAFCKELSDTISCMATNEEILELCTSLGVDEDVLKEVKVLILAFSSKEAEHEAVQLEKLIVSLNDNKSNVIDYVKNLLQEHLENIEKSFAETVSSIAAELQHNIDEAIPIRNIMSTCEDLLQSYTKITTFEELNPLALKQGVSKTHLDKIVWLIAILEENNGDKDRTILVKEGLQKILSVVERTVSFHIFLLEIRRECESAEVIASKVKITELVQRLTADNLKNVMEALCVFGFHKDLVQMVDTFQMDETRSEKLKKEICRNLNSNLKIDAKSPLEIRYFDATLVLSQALKELPKPNCQLVIVTASQKLVVDMDLELTNTHLLIVAPVVEFLGVRKIHMRGEDGKSHERKARSSTNGSEPGADGKDGGNGLSSGSLRLVALELINCRQLTIRTEGGNGGNGQDGGDGCNAVLTKRTTSQEKTVMGASRAEEELQKASLPLKPLKAFWSSVTALIDKSVFEPRQCSEVEEKSVICFQEQPTNGGRGGNGGSGAPPGAVIFNTPDDAEVATMKLHKVTGENGKPGKGGRAGKNPGGEAFVNVTDTEPTLINVCDGAGGNNKILSTIENYKYALDDSVVHTQIEEFRNGLKLTGFSLGAAQELLEYYDSKAVLNVGKSRKRVVYSVD